jgi:hypothetical protein
MKTIPGSIRRTGGPRSEKGKATAANNALKSGIYTRHIFLDGEDKKEFEALRQSLYDDLAPQTLIQHVLVEDVLVQLWRKFRLERYASKKLKELSERQITLSDLLNDLGPEAIGIHEKAKRVTDDVRANGVEYYQDWLKKIQDAQQLHPRHCENLEVFKVENPDLYQLMRKFSLRGDRFDSLVIANEKNSDGASFWESELKFLEEWAQNWILCFKCEDMYIEAIPRIFQNRIYKHLISGDIDRASDDVTRALHRALAEYYKERDRYRKEIAILVDPDDPRTSVGPESKGGVDVEFVETDSA